MTDKTLLGVGVLGAALALGVLGDALLRATPWGLSLALAALRTWPGQVRVATLTDYALTVVYAFVHAVGGSVPLLFQEIRWRQLPGGRWYALALAAARGVLIAIPVVLVFGALFVAADPVFERLVAGLFDWDLGEVFDHALGTAVCAWLAAGLLRGVLLEPDGARAAGAAAAPGARASGWSLGAAEIGVALGLVDPPFLAFVLVQVRYLFGGAAQVSPATGLTYAEYARRGFFELVAVTALTLPLLLLAHSFLRR